MCDDSACMELYDCVYICVSVCRSVCEYVCSCVAVCVCGYVGVYARVCRWVYDEYVICPFLMAILTYY